MLLLGGGGYSEYNVARTWAALSYAALDEPLPENVPEHEFFEAYQPDYTFAIRPSYRR